MYNIHSKQPDSSGHEMGPYKSEVSVLWLTCLLLHVNMFSHLFSVLLFLHLQLKHPLKAIDAVIGQLMNGLKQMNLHRCANVIVMGDHGTTPARSSASFLSLYLHTSLFKADESVENQEDKRFQMQSAQSHSTPLSEEILFWVHFICTNWPLM